MTTRDRHQGAPQGYDVVSECFGSISERAAALGVERDTIRNWDSRGASKLRSRSRERVAVLAAVCRDLRAAMDDPAAVGRWLLTEQPGLMGVRPTDVLLRFGAEGGRFVSLVAHGRAPVRPGDVPDSESFWRAVEAKLSDGELAWVAETRERARDFSGSLSLA